MTFETTNGTHAAGTSGPPGELIARTWLVPSDLASQVAALADGLQVTHSAVVRELLRHALADARAGRLDLQTRPSRWEIVGVSDG